jgi:hypothetical protein
MERNVGPGCSGSRHRVFDHERLQRAGSGRSLRIFANHVESANYDIDEACN